MTLLLFTFRPNKSTMCVHVQILKVINNVYNICIQQIKDQKLTFYGLITMFDTQQSLILGRKLTYMIL